MDIWSDVTACYQWLIAALLIVYFPIVARGLWAVWKDTEEKESDL